MAPPRLASGLHSLPPILHVTVPNPIPGYSKAPRGLFVLPQVARVFTGTAISPSLRRDNGQVVQPFMRVGTYPTRGLRYLRHFCYSRSRSEGPVISAGLCMSPHRSDHIFPQVPSAGPRMVSEDSVRLPAIPWTFNSELGRRFALTVFPADCPHRTHCYRLTQIRSTGSAGYSDFPAYSQILQRP